MLLEISTFVVVRRDHSGHQEVAANTARASKDFSVADIAAHVEANAARGRRA
jgi:hypothetical protein